MHKNYFVAQITLLFSIYLIIRKFLFSTPFFIFLYLEFIFLVEVRPKNEDLTTP